MALGAVGGGGLTTGAVTGIIGGIGGAIAAAEQKRMAARERRRFRSGMERGERQTKAGVFDILQSPEFQAARNFALGTFGIAPGGAGAGGYAAAFGGQRYEDRPTLAPLRSGLKRQAKQLGSQLGKALTASQQLESGTSFSGKAFGARARAHLESMGSQENVRRLLGTLDASPNAEFKRTALTALESFGFLPEHLSRFRPEVAEQTLEGGGGPPGSEIGVPGFGLNSPLARDFSKALRQSQASRGILNSEPGAYAEAAGLAAFNFQQQRELLPFLTGLASQPEQLYQQFRQGNVAAGVQRATGGGAVYGTPYAAGGHVGVLSQSIAAGLAGFGGGGGIGEAALGGQGGGGFQGFQQAGPGGYAFNPQSSINYGYTLQ